MTVLTGFSRSVSRSITRGLGQGQGGGGAVSVASVLALVGWTPDVSITESSGGYSTNFDITNFMGSPTASYYVNVTTGNNSNSGLSSGAAVKTIQKAIQLVAASGATTANIYIAAGFYDRNNHFRGETAAVNINFIGQGDVISSATFEAQTWSSVGSGAYKATRSTVHMVYDKAQTDSYGNATRLATAASSAACISTAGSWYTDGVDVWVHTTDGREPDSNVILCLNATHVNFAANNTWTFQGITFEGGRSAFDCAAAPGASSQLVFDRCVFRYSGSLNGLGVQSVAKVYANRCVAYNNVNDGFNYHGTAADVKAMEIDCTAYNNGVSGDTSDNGSSAHENSRVVRVGCRYFSNYGAGCVDIDTTKSACFGVTSTGSVSAAGTTKAGFYISAGSMYLVRCVAAEQTYSCTITSGGTMQQSASNLTGSVSGTLGILG